MNITLVTAFFDIGKESIEQIHLRRSRQKYYDYFRHWARIQNELYVYTDKETAEFVMEVRGDFGLADKTKIHVVDDLYALESDIYRRMKNASERDDLRNFRYYPKALSNNAEYDFVMLMKYYFINITAQLVDESVDAFAWLDFGWEHGGRRFPNDEDYDFLWDYDFGDKINIFALKGKDPDKISGIDSLQLLTDTLMGCQSIVPVRLTDTLWSLIKSAMEALLMLDCIDDDQQLVLMAYKARPDLFKVRYSDWFLPIKEYGNPNMREKPKKKDTMTLRLIQMVKKVINILLHSFELKNRAFSHRSLKRAQKFYGKQ